MGWNFDMDAAPRDGTEILIFDDVGVMEICEWVDGAWVVTWNHDQFSRPCIAEIAWMHLPEPPK